MATTTDGTLIASMEEQNPASAMAEEEPLKKDKLTVTTTNEAASLAPLGDLNPAAMKEEAPKKVEMLVAAGEGKEAFMKVMVNEEEKEMKDVELEGRPFPGSEVVNSEAEGDIGVDNGGEVEESEEDSKGGSLGIVEAMNDDENEVPALQNTIVVVSVVEPASMPTVQSKLENCELEKEDASLISSNVPKGEEGGELQEEEQKEKVTIIVEAKVPDKIEDDAESVEDKVKPEPESEKIEEVGSGGGDGGKLDEVKEAKISIVTIEVVDPENRQASFAELNGELGYQKEVSNDTMIVGGEEGRERSIEKDVDVLTSEASKVIVSDGSIEVFALANVENVLKDIPGIQQKVEGQLTANEVVENVGVEKFSNFENITDTIEEVGVKKHKMTENIIDIVEDIDIKKHIEDMKNDVSRELEVQEIKIVISMVEPTPMPSVESKSEDGELRDEDASLASHDASDGEEREEVGAIMQAKVADKIENDAESAMTREKKVELDGEKIVKIGSKDQDGGKLDEEKETEVSIFSIKTVERDDKLAPFDEDNGELNYLKEASDDTVVVGGEEAMKESIMKDDDVPMNEVSTVAINDQSIEEVSPRSANNMFEDSHGIEKNDEGQTTTEEEVEVVGTEKPLEFENIVDVVEDVGIEKHIEVENFATVVESVGIEKKIEAVKDDASREPAAQDTNSVVFAVELKPMPTVGSKLEEGELSEVDASLDSPDVLEGEKTYELWEEVQEEEVGSAVEGKITNELAYDAESAVAEEENLEPKYEQIDEVGFGGGDGGKKGEEKEVEVSAITVEVADPEDKLAPFVETIGEYGYQKASSDYTIAMEGVTKKDVYVPTSEASTMVINDRSIEEVSVRSANNIFENSLEIEKNDEDQTTTDEVVEVVAIKKPLESENILGVVENVGIEKHIEVENIATIVEDVDIEKKTEAVKDDASREPAAQDIDSIVFAVELTPMPTVGSKLEKGELSVVDGSLDSPDALAYEAESAVAEEENLKEKCEQVDEVGFGGGDGSKMGEVKEVEISAVTVEVADPEDKLAPFVKMIVEYDYQKESSDYTMAMKGKEVLENSTKKSVCVPTSEASTVVMNDGSIEEVDVASVDSVLKCSPEVEQNVERQTNVNEVVEDVGHEKASKFENIVDALKEIGVNKHKVVESIADIVGGIDVKKNIEIVTDDLSSEQKVQDVEVIISAVEPTPTLAVDFKLEGGELGETYASLTSPDVLEGELRGEFQEEQWDEELDAIVEAKVANTVVDDAETAVVEDEKSEPEGEKVEEVGFGDRDGDKLGEGNETKISTVIIEATKLEDKLTSFTEANSGLSFQKESCDDIMAMGGEGALEELIQQDVHVSSSEASTMVVNDGSTEKVVLATVDSVLEDSPWIQQNAEGQATVNEVLDDIDVQKLLEFENFVGMIEDVDEKKHKEVKNIADVIEVVDVEKHTEIMKDNVRREPVVQDTDVVISMVEPVPIPTMESNLDNSELGEGDASLVSTNTSEGDKRGEYWEEEEVGVVVHAMIVNKVVDVVKSAVVEKEKPEPEGDKVEEVASRCGDSGQLGNDELGYQKQPKDDMVVVGGEVMKESIEKVVVVPTSEASTMVVNEGCIEKVVPASTNSVLEDSLKIEQYVERQVTANKVVEDVGIEKPLKVENVDVVIEDVDVKRYIEVEDAAVVVEGIDVEKLMKIQNMTATSSGCILPQELAPESSQKNNYAKGSEYSTEVIDREEEIHNDRIIKIVTTNEDGVGYEAYEYNDGANSDTSPAWIAILKSTESTKQIMKEFVEGSSNSSVSGSRDFTNSMDEQIMLDDSKETDDNVDGDKKGFDSVALEALLEGETSRTSYENIIVSCQDGSKILTMDGPANPESSTPCLMPTAPCQRALSNVFIPTELAVTADPTEEMTEEQKNLHDKVELIRVKFLRLVYRLGATFEEIVTSLVLYRLRLVEGIMHLHGRQTNQNFSLDNAWKKALILEADGKEDLNFSCSILVLGKTGVGKSATINSIFGEDKSKTDAFSSATTSVREYVGDVHGIKIRIIDTPGFQTSVMDQGSNRKILAAIKKYTKKCPPDIVMYVDRLDSLGRDNNDLPLLKTITSVLGSSIWFNAIVALTHATSAPPEGLYGASVTYEVLLAQRSHVIHQTIRQVVGDMCLMNPIALVENHPSCKRNHEGHKVLPNGQSWRHQMLFLCYSSKILCEANSLLKFQDPKPRELFGFHFLTLPFMLSSLMQSRVHPKLSPEKDGNEGDFHIKLNEYSNVQQDDDEEKHDRLPPFKPLTKDQLARLTRKQKKQWKNEICKLKEMKKRGKIDLDNYGYANNGENDQDPPLDNVSVPLPNIVLPPSFDCDNPIYRYRFLEPTSTILARPILDAHRWDHEYGYDGVSMEDTLAILDRFPANVVVQVTKDKKEFSIHLDSSIAAKHGENASSLAGFDIQMVGQQPAYILRGETKIKNIKKNETTGGFSLTFLGDTVATGLKVEDQLSLGKRLSLVASTGAMQAHGDTVYGANLEACLKDKHYPIGQSQSTLGLSLMKWGRDLALGANLESQFSIGRGSKMAFRLGMNNKLSGKITVRTSTSEQVQIALLGLVPVAASIYRSFRPSEPSSV